MMQNVEQFKTKKSAFRTVLDVLSTLFLVVLGVFIVCMLVFMFKGMKENDTPSIFGHQIYIVRSNSMSPAFETGSLLIVTQVDARSVQVNDVITFRGENDSVATTHRVVEIVDEDGLHFITRGDANNVNDPLPVPADEVIGRVVFSIPYIGYLLGFIRTKQGLLICIIIPAMIIIVSQVLSFVRELKKEKKNGTEKIGTGVQELLSNTRQED